MSQLNVYKASAGSGKTFTLAVEYISLLVKDPTSYKNILAVTFTNKATDEMKTRILSQLYGISKGLQSSDSYLNAVYDRIHKNDENITKEQIRQKAETALSLIIHNYNYFKISTIDAFFQTIMRSIAYELNLSPNLRVELNDKQVVEEAVNVMIDELEADDKGIFKWLMSYINSNIQENKTWNIIKNILHFGDAVLSDEYKFHEDEIRKGSDHIDDYIKKLRAIAQNSMSQIRTIADEYYSLLNDNGLEEIPFKGNSRGIDSYFKKLKSSDNVSLEKTVTATVLKCMYDVDSWVTRDTAAELSGFVQTTMIPFLIDAERRRGELWCMYISSKEILRHINELRLLGEIGSVMERLNKESNRFLLSNTQYLLNKIINDNDSSFIYERIGTKLEHIMIDEFQDTSMLQWKNFKVLLKECMSRSEDNLIVGDVKQSIYRWRNGDWRILNNIDHELKDAHGTIETKNLKENRRSNANIILFNNSFFQRAVDIIKESIDDDEKRLQLERAYEDVAQKIPTNSNNGEGYVEVDFVRANIDSGYVETTIKIIEDSIIALLEKGVRQKDIAIIIRTNKYIPLIAEYFSTNNPNIKIISDEAFQLRSSESVNRVMAALKYIANPEDNISQAMAEDVAGEEVLEQLKELSNMPLYAMVENICSVLNIKSPADGAYLCTFFDNLSSFIANKSADIEDFINFWDDTLSLKTIQSDDIDGVRIMSIHKSKGLESDYVIIPFNDWNIELGNTLWCKPTISPFNELEIVPIEYGTSLNESIFIDDYEEEHFQKVVDNLNLLYVAFTRAKKHLYIISQYNVNKKGEITTTKTNRADLIRKTVEKMHETSDIESNFTEENDIRKYIFGKYDIDEKRSQTDKDNIFTITPRNKTIDIVSFPEKVMFQEIGTVDNDDKKIHFRQSNDSNTFMKNIVGEEDEYDDNLQVGWDGMPNVKKQEEFICNGKILHALFSKIRNINDIDKELRKFQQEGLLYNDQMPKESLIKLIHDRLTNDTVREWFSERWTRVFNETNILLRNEKGLVEKKRPDRVITDGKKYVVIDFKFGKPKDIHKQQVREYVEILHDMGNEDVEGFLWYFYSNKIEKV